MGNKYYMFRPHSSFRNFINEVTFIGDDISFIESDDNIWKMLEPVSIAKRIGTSTKNKINYYYFRSIGGTYVGFLNGIAVVNFSLDFPSRDDRFPIIASIETNSIYKGRGFGIETYLFLIDMYGGIYSGYEQSRLGMKAWTKLLDLVNIFVTVRKSYEFDPIKTQKELESVYTNSNSSNTLLFATKSARLPGPVLNEIYLSQKDHRTDDTDWDEEPGHDPIDRFANGRMLVYYDRYTGMYSVYDTGRKCVVFELYTGYDYPEVRMIETNPIMSGRGYGFRTYAYLIEKYKGIYSDTIHSPGTKITWKRLMDHFDMYITTPRQNSPFLKRIFSEQDFETVYSSEMRLLATVPDLLN